VAAVIATGLLLAAAAPAGASTVQYTVQIGRSVTAKLALAGDRVTEFSANIGAQQCTNGDISEDSDAVWTVSLARSSSVALNDRSTRDPGASADGVLSGG
jgi:hypothetical protein